MSISFRDFLSMLRDSSRYVRVPHVTIFDEHEEEYFVDEDGKPCPAGKPGAKRKMRKFSRERLQEIASTCNKRDKTGSLSPLTFGHTDPGETDETKQPPPVGYAHDYKVVYSPDHGRHVLQTDFYIRRDKFEEAKTFPRVSIELWDRHSIVDPISLLRRCPQRDLGQWTYGRGHGAVLRYSMEFQMPERYEMEDDPVQNAMPDDLPDGPKPGESDGDEMTPEEHDQYMRHCYSHPMARKYAAHCAKKYGMAEAPSEAPPAEGDPTDAPSADEPMQNGMAYPSATNAAPVQRKSRDASQGVERFRRNGGDQILYKRIEELENREARKEAENWVLRLSDQEGYEMNEEAEVERFARCYRSGGEEACQKHADHIRSFHKQKVTHRTGPVSRADLPARAPAGYDPDNPESMPLADQQAVYQYQREHNLWDTPWSELAALALPKRYAKTK